MSVNIYDKTTGTIQQIAGNAFDSGSGGGKRGSNGGKSGSQYKTGEAVKTLQKFLTFCLLFSSLFCLLYVFLSTSTRHIFCIHVSCLLG